MLTELPGRFAEPPVDLDLPEEALEVYAVTLWSMLAGVVTHGLWIPLFYGLGVAPLAGLNVLSTALFAWAVVVCRQGKLTLALALAAGEVCVHAWAATWFLGWNTQFHMHTLLAMVLGIDFTTMKIQTRVLYALAIGLSWVILAVAAPMFAEPAALDRRVVEFLAAMNLVIFVTVLAGIALYHSWGVSRSREARREVQVELAASVGRTQAILERMADGLVAFDSEMRVVALNRSLAHWLDESEVEFNNTDTRTRAMPALWDLARKAVERGEVSQVEVAMPNDRIGSAIATPLPDQGAVVLVRDITAAKQVDRMKSEFTALVSHELRTPLTSVLGFAKLIRKAMSERIEPALGPDRRARRAAGRVSEQLEVILEEGERLTALINDVLDLAKMEAGQITMETAPLDVAELVRAAAAATHGLFTERQLTVEIDDDLPRLRGDRNRLQQVLINLLSNAAKFAHEGVLIRVVRDKQGARFEVVDDGPGIALAEQDLVFEKYRQANAAASTGGTGLGLPISREIVLAHHGRIGVESHLGSGARFWFWLPIDFAAAA